MPEYKKLCSSANKINSLGKPSNRWKDIYVNKAILGDGNADSNVSLIADITGTDINPELKYNVTEQKWQVSHDGASFGNIQSIHVSTENPDNSIGVNGDLWVVYGNNVQCTGPWSWVKLVLFPGELYDQLTYVSVPFFDVSLGNMYFNYDIVPIIDPTIGMGTPGSAYASSEYPGDIAANAFDGFTGLDYYNAWYSEEVSTPRTEWLAYHFNTPVSFNYAYIVLEMNFATRYTYGSICASNNSTNGEDGTWYTFREDIFPMPDLVSGTYMITVPLCTEDEIIWGQLDEPPRT